MRGLAFPRAYAAPGVTLARPPEAGPAPSGLHRGWGTVLGAFLVVMVGFGAIYSASAFVADIALAFGASRAEASFVYALAGGACFFVSALSGPLADRVGPRPLALAGMLLVGAGLAVAALSSTMLGAHLGYGLMVGLGAGLAYVPALAAVQRWFLRRRGLASGVAVSGIGVGTALVPALAGALEPLGDWRTAFLVCAALSVAVGAAGALLLDAEPWRHGLGPDGVPLPPGGGGGGARAAQEPDTAAAVATPGFALAYLGCLLVALPVALPYGLLAATATDLGVSARDAVALLGFVGAGSVLGRFLIGAAADWLGRRRCFLLCCAGVSLSLLLWASAWELWGLEAFALLFGALQGGFVALLPAFVADRFGARSAAGVMGVLYTGRGLALVAGPPLFALGLAWAGSHGGPVLLAAALGLLGTALLARVGR